jgi:hypothetical protein
MLPFWCIFLPISSRLEGALSGTLWNVGVGAAPAGVGSCPRTRGALGNRPCPLRGAALSGWTRQVKGGETRPDGELARACARKNGPGDEEVAVTGRRKALPWPLFPGDPGNKLRSLHYKVRLSAFRLPLLIRGGSLKPPFTRRILRAAMTLARGKERNEMRAHHTYSVIRGLDPRIHHASQESFEEDGLPGQAGSDAWAKKARRDYGVRLFRTP